MNHERKNRSRTRSKRRHGRQHSERRHKSSNQSYNTESHRTSAPGCSRDPDLVHNDKKSTSQADRSYMMEPKSRQRPQSSSSRMQDVSNSSTNTLQSDSPQECDIPGYYYDREAKLYFKIQSYNLGSVTPFITKEKIANKQKESQRVNDIKNLTNKTVSPSAALSGSGVSVQKRNDHIVNVLKNIQCGQFTCENMRTYMIRHMCSRIQPDSKWDNSLPGQPNLLLGDIQNMEVSKRRDKIACVSSLKSSYSHIIQLMTVDEQELSHSSEIKRKVLRVNVPFLAHGPIHKRIKTMCWAPLRGRRGQATVLYTTVCPIGCLASIVYLSNLEAETEDERNIFELNLGKNIIWSSAWSTHGQKFTIGTERKCYLTDVATRKQWTFNTFDSDPLAQLFSSSGLSIYNGTRRGQILLHDVRAPERGHYSLMMKQDPGVGCLRLLKDENYLMAGDFSGTICTWDQRMRHKVMEYKGLMNSHWQLPFIVDETESLLTSTGSDSYTKIWDMKTGEILRNIPPLYPVSCDGFPLSFYSTRWGNKDGNSALLVAMRNHFRFFTYKDTLQ